jgi:hypothetical protein
MQEGRAPSPAELATSLAMAEQDVIEALRSLAGDDVIALQPGTDQIWLAHPFCALDAPFVVSAEDRRWDAICIWDALGILAIGDIDGVVETECPDCDAPLRVEVSGGRSTAPTKAVVHFGVPASRWYEDIAHT